MNFVHKMLCFMIIVLSMMPLCGCKAVSSRQMDAPAALTTGNGDLSEPADDSFNVNLEDTEASAPFDAGEEYVLSATGWYQMSNLIYHACGIVDDVAYTNSREAMDSTLAKGNMLVEVDFLFTTDGHLICGHKWKDIIPVEEDPKKKKKKTEEEVPEKKCDLDTFLTLKIKEKYTGLTGADIISYMKDYPSLHIVLDTKEEDASLVVAELLRLCDYQPEIADRFVVQLYDRGQKQKMLELYPFQDSSFLFTCYKFDPLRVEEILQICRDERISIVTVAFGSWEQETVNLFLEEGIVLFEHTVNLPEEAELSLQKGIYGFYTDSLQESQLNTMNY